MTKPDRKESPCIAAATRAASRRLTQLYDEIMAPSGLRVTQYHLLSELERGQDHPPTVSELAELVTMERSALGQTLRPLERDGLVKIARDPHDARRRPLLLTPAGQRTVTRGRRYWARAHRLFERYFGAVALADLRSTLRHIAQDPSLPESFRVYQEAQSPARSPKEKQ